MVLEHTLKRTGTKTIDTNAYNPGFFMLDGHPTGPDITVTFPSQVNGSGEMGGLAEARGNRIVYLKALGEADRRRQVASGPIEIPLGQLDEEEATGVSLRDDHGGA